MADPLDVADTPFDLLVVMDTTGSMSTFANALNKSLPDVINISALTGCFERIGLLAYRDYCRGELTEWSGWCCPSGKLQGPDMVSQDDVLNMARGIRTVTTSDWPEASRTGLARAYSVMRPNATTLILLYTDAPPHWKETNSLNYHREKTALEKNTTYSDSDSLFVDWVTAANTLRSGPKKGVVFSIIHRCDLARSPYLYLSTMTGGNLIEIMQMFQADDISQVTIGLLLTWMQLGNTVTGETSLACLTRYQSVDDLHTATNEDDQVMASFLAKDPESYHALVSSNIQTLHMTLSELPSLVEARGPNVGNFAERYRSDKDYRKLAADQLLRIMETNGSVVSINPIFGGLWRVACTDRCNDDRDKLIRLFGQHLEKISNVHEKARVKTWLEESFNQVEEINDLIDSVAPQDRFPLIFWEPYGGFGTMAANGGRENVTEQPRRPQDVTRLELLEIRRSCDQKTLQRLGRVLTGLTFARDKHDVPYHIRRTDLYNSVPCVPWALTEEVYNCQFWKLLLHTVVPGTKLSARPAALLAALTLRMGIMLLRDAADQELLSFSDDWNRLDIPETWNLGCLNLVLDADQDYEKRVADGVTTRPTVDSRVLADNDRDMFKLLVDYKMLELNLDTTLQANIGWTPNKNKVPLGPVVICNKCGFPRSVTMMAAGGVCGLCDVGCKCRSCVRGKDYDKRSRKNVSAEHNENSTAYWVECEQTACRAQYVTYNPDVLDGHPKCYFCRHRKAQDEAPLDEALLDEALLDEALLDEALLVEAPLVEAPLVECSQCTSRIIWPAEYRPDDLDLAKYRCAACLAGIATVVSEETSGRKLMDENGHQWFLKNEDGAIKEPFTGRSVYDTALHCDLDNLPAKVQVLPATSNQLTIRGKPVLNSDEIRKTLVEWVASRRTEFGTCSLCFASFRKLDIHTACGRSRCRQAICNGCRDSWYGSNGAGRIINPSALVCPFCRRQPVPSVVRQYGIAHVGDIKRAVDKNSSWIYAWCVQCGFARQYVERVCAAGMPLDVRDWRCDGCRVDEAREPILMCPGCGVPTQKTAGCDHITCPCGTHWCYACGKATPLSDIYMHIAMEHGGLQWEDEEDEEDDWA